MFLGHFLKRVEYFGVSPCCYHAMRMFSCPFSCSSDSHHDFRVLISYRKINTSEAFVLWKFFWFWSRNKSVFHPLWKTKSVFPYSHSEVFWKTCTSVISGILSSISVVVYDSWLSVGRGFHHSSTLQPQPLRVRQVCLLWYWYHTVLHSRELSTSCSGKRLFHDSWPELHSFLRFVVG